MIVEITGIPGAGKSYLLSEAQRAFGDRLGYADDLTALRIGLIRVPRLLKHIHTLRFVLGQIAGGTAKRATELPSISGDHTLERARRTWNVQAKYAVSDLVESWSNRSEVPIVVDEGISHLPYNLWDRYVTPTDIRDRLDSILRYALPRRTVIEIKVDSAVAVSRIAERGHWRISNSLDASEFVDACQSLADTMRPSLTRYASRYLQVGSTNEGVDALGEIL